MAVAAHAPTLPARDVWHGRYGAPLVLALLILPFAAALMLAAVRPSMDQAAVTQAIRDTAGLVEEHAASMITAGEHVVAAAARLSSADRAEWMAYGQHMITDGRALRVLSERLRATATVAEKDPQHSGSSVAAAVLHARWEQLRADGRATAEHGRVMVRMAEDLSAGVRAHVLGEADVQQIRQAAAGMADAGERVVRVADLLLFSTAQMRRWMAAGP